ncbi:MAG: hypothetical protein ACRER6_15590, partial [Pseudomonas sp.]
FKNLHERFADSTGGADHGNINGLAHGLTSGETAGAALYRVVGMQAIRREICGVRAGLIASKLAPTRIKKPAPLSRRGLFHCFSRSTL